MKKFFIALFFTICLVSPVKVYSASAVGSAILAMIHEQQIVQWLMDMGYQIKQAADDALSVYQSYEQLQHWIRNEKRYLDNLASVVNVRSLGGLMDWFNRAGYIARESERIYSNMGVTVGGKHYDLSEIDEIPDALRNEDVDKHWGDLSENERYKAWTSLGMSPSNYLYMKTWQGRNEEIKKRLLTSREMHLEEMEEAASRNDDVIGSYANGDIDTIKIAKNSGASLAHIEMAIRDLTVTTDDFVSYIVGKDQEAATPPTPMMPYDGWNNTVFKPITDRGNSKNNFENF